MTLFVDFDKPLYWVVDDFLTATECQTLVHRIDAAGPEVAPISALGGPVMDTQIRNNGRVIFDDIPLAQRLYRRALAHVPERIFQHQVFGLNERFRCYRYEPGQYFRAHYDGCYRRNEQEESHLTFLMYLSDEMRGGETHFNDLKASVAPAVGRALFFQHRLLHEGMEVEQGLKYVLRTDVMYRRAPE